MKLTDFLKDLEKIKEKYGTLNITLAQINLVLQGGDLHDILKDN